jgi:hypothetical protein
VKWLALCLVWGMAVAEDDLLKVGKTPAEKLEQETQKAKDNVEAALQKYEQKKQLLTQTLQGNDEYSSRPVGPSASEAWNVGFPDPTQADPEFQRQFRALLRGGKASGGSEALPPMPQIALVGKVDSLGQRSLAMLRIDNKDVLVREKDRLSFLNQGQPITIQVQEINQHAVTVIVFPHNLPLTLR